MSTLFLTDEELATLTGRRLKSAQITWLRGSGLPFRISATGHPVVTRSAVEGRPQESAPARWTPRAIGGNHGTQTNPLGQPATRHARA